MGFVNRYTKDKKSVFILIGFLIIILMLIHIEVILSRHYAPENMLMRLANPTTGLPQENASCKASISSHQVNIENKSLQELESVYDFVDSSTYDVNSLSDKGFYVLKTGFKKYTGKYEINIACTIPGYKYIVYTNINNSYTS